MLIVSAHPYTVHVIDFATSHHIDHALRTHAKETFLQHIGLAAILLT